MGDSLRALIVAGVEHDMALVLLELKRAGYAVEFGQVDRPETMARALARDQRWDVAICDVSPPRLDVRRSLELLRARRPHIPLIAVSRRIDEGSVVEALRAGAVDVMAKSRLSRLGPAVEKGLRDAAAHAEQSRDQQRLQAEARRNEQRFRALFEFTPDALLVSDDAGSIVLANPRAESMFDYPCGMLVGHPLEAVLEGASSVRSAGAGAEDEFILIGLPWIMGAGRFDLVGRRRDGTTISVEVSNSLMEAIDGRRVITVVRNVDRDPVQEAGRRSHAESSTRRLATIGALAAGIAHDINTPIQFVGDSIAFLRTAAPEIFDLVGKLQVVHRLIRREDRLEPLPPDLVEAAAAAAAAEEDADFDYLRDQVPVAIERCVDGVARVTGIVNAMKEFAHPGRREMAPADLNRAIESTLTLARNEYKYVADVKTELGSLPPVVCRIDEINQVILNLVVNAAHAIGDVVKGSERRGTITVRTWLEGEQVVCAISDTGTGISASIRDRVFLPFFTTKELGKGTGQGLALAWNVIKEMHHGELTFESEVGRGTTFYIRLPCR
jgi:PAS domain S-box-containing protein